MFFHELVDGGMVLAGRNVISNFNEYTVNTLYVFKPYYQFINIFFTSIFLYFWFSTENFFKEIIYTVIWEYNYRVWIYKFIVIMD